MKILIAGDGKVGSKLAGQLSAAGHEITLIDKKPEVLAAGVEKHDVMGIVGNCASKDTLQEAGVLEASLLIAATSADEINLLCCITAHALNPRIHTIARIRNPEYTEQVYEMRELFGLSMAVNPEKQAAVEIEHLLKYPGFLKRDPFVQGRVEIVELRVAAGSILCNVALCNMNALVKCRVLVCAVLRSGEVIMPGGDFVFREGDRLFVTAPTSDMTTLLKNLGIFTHKVRRVMICGGGRVSFYLAQQLLRSGISVQIIEQDRARCMELAELLPKAFIVHGDAGSQQLLESEGLGECDALVNLTGLDEINIILALYGHNRGVKQIITKLGHLENSSIVEDLPVGSIVSPKDICCGTIARYVRAMHNQTGAAVAVQSIADGKAEASEFRVTKETPHLGTPLRALRFKKGVLIACIVKGARTEIPNGDSFFDAGDTLIVVSGSDREICCLDDIFDN